MNSAYPIEIFQTEDGQIRLEVQLKEETVWLTQKQMGRLFGRERSVITKHINNIFKEDELARDSVSANFAHTAEDGKTYQTRYFNLDVIISVGYRVKSRRGVQFRQWATRVLKEHLVRGYTFNRTRLAQLGTDVDRLMGLMHRTLTRNQMVSPEGGAIASLIRDYARTWKLLLAFDENRLEEPDDSPCEPVLDAETVRRAIDRLKAGLIKNGQATDLFGRERDNALDGILGNLHQTFDGQLLYPTPRARAAHLLYFIIKDHPFADGNKRIGSFLFLLYLQAHGLDRTEAGGLRFADNALVALALLTAESDPGQKELMIRLIQHLIGEGV